MDLVVAHCYLGHFKKLRIIIIINNNSRHFSVMQLLIELGLPSWNTLIISSQSVFVKSWQICENRLDLSLVHARFKIMYSPYFSMCLQVCLCVCVNALFYISFNSIYISVCFLCRMDLVTELNLMMMINACYCYY